jgi:hypothetical protein
MHFYPSLRNKYKMKTIPEVLYKFRDDSTRTEEIIVNRKIWLSFPSQLNDPLECKIGKIPEIWMKKTIEEMEMGQLMGVIFPKKIRLFSLTEQETHKWYKRLAKLPHDRKVRAMRNIYADHGVELSRPELIFKDMQNRLDTVGIFSLTECCDSELMWSHYGANHHGIAFGFSADSESNKLSNPYHCIPVIYNPEKPTFKTGFKQEVTMSMQRNGVSNSSRVAFDDDVFRATISTKTPAWQYEQEWRYVEEKYGLFDFPGTLTRLIFGMNMPLEKRMNYIRLCKKHIANDVSFFEARLKPSLDGIEIVKFNQL